jgi:hypothetical protein
MRASERNQQRQSQESVAAPEKQPPSAKALQGEQVSSVDILLEVYKDGGGHAQPTSSIPCAKIRVHETLQLFFSWESLCNAIVWDSVCKNRFPSMTQMAHWLSTSPLQIRRCSLGALARLYIVAATTKGNEDSDTTAAPAAAVTTPCAAADPPPSADTGKSNDAMGEFVEFLFLATGGLKAGDGIQPPDFLAEFVGLWKRAWEFEFQERRTVWQESVTEGTLAPNLNGILKSLVGSHAYSGAAAASGWKAGGGARGKGQPSTFVSSTPSPLKDIQLVSHHLMDNLPLHQVRLCVCKFLLVWIRSCWLPSVYGVLRGHLALKSHTRAWSERFFNQQERQKKEHGLQLYVGIYKTSTVEALHSTLHQAFAHVPR